MCDSREKNTGLDALNEAFMELDRAYVQLARACGLSEAEFWCLVAVRHGAETQREICEQLSLSPQTVNSAFKLLIRKGLIRLEPYAHNQRSKRAILTGRGRDFALAHVAPLEAVEAEAWDTLSRAEQAQLISLLRRFSAAMTGLLPPSQKFDFPSSEGL